MEWLDHMEQSAHISEYKQSARIRDCESELDVLRRENTALMKEVRGLSIENTVEGKAARDGGEITTRL